MAKAKQTEAAGDPSYADLYRKSINYRAHAKDFKRQLTAERDAHAKTKAALEKATADLATKPAKDEKPKPKTDDAADEGEHKPPPKPKAKPDDSGSMRIGSTFTDSATRPEPREPRQTSSGGFKL